ncbi:hypothetical protein J2S52_002122 [Streptomyces sp. DSM 41037]|nr:hypothetical protein [Streptomyces sp. DSM 41037]
MRAVVHEAERRVAVREVEDAVVEEETDALVRITSSALCGTDLHMYDGRTGAGPGMVLGHERGVWSRRPAARPPRSAPVTASSSPPTCTAAPARTARGA